MGTREKEQMQQMVRYAGMSETPSLRTPPTLAVALCHVQAAQYRARLDAGSAERPQQSGSPKVGGGSHSRIADSRI